MSAARVTIPAVLAAGACSPLGITAEATAAEAAAGTSRFAATDVPDTTGEPVRASPLTILPEGADRGARVMALAITAASDPALAARLAATPRIGLALALPAGVTLDPTALAARPGLQRIELLRDGVFAAGRAAFFHALRRAQVALAQDFELVLVGAADSLCDRASLQRLAGDRRTLGPDNPDGLIPGEGAAFVLLGRSRPGGRPLAALLGCSTATDSAPPLGAAPSRSEGLTAAFRGLRTDPIAGGRRADALYSAQTGESAWARELAHAYQRNTALMPEPFTFQIAGALFGDAGAAAPALMTALALADLSAHPPGRRALVYGCADDGAVGACILEGLAHE